MTSEFRLDAEGILRCDELLAFDFIKHGFGSKLGNPDVDVTLRQIHSDVVWNATGLKDREEQGDALVSNLAGLALGIRTADCVPILLVDSKTRAVAAVHAGWRGTAAGIAQKAVGRLAEDFGSAPQHVYAAIGPCIQACCYQVGAEVVERFAPYFPEWTDAARPRHLDLVAANFRQLVTEGVPATQIFDSGLCTFCQADRLFSFRREPENPGRMIAAISRLF